MPGNELLTPLEERRAYIERTRENSARTARAYITHKTTGWGEKLVDQPVLFGCTFIQPPAVISGTVVESSVAAGDDEPLVAGRFPRVNMGVWKWVQDVHNFYTGAYLYFVVETVGYQLSVSGFPGGEDPNYSITHHIVFEGISYKDFNPAGLDY